MHILFSNGKQTHVVQCAYISSRHLVCIELVRGIQLVLSHVINKIVKYNNIDHHISGNKLPIPTQFSVWKYTIRVHIEFHLSIRPFVQRKLDKLTNMSISLIVYNAITRCIQIEDINKSVSHIIVSYKLSNQRSCS